MDSRGQRHRWAALVGRGSDGRDEAVEDIVAGLRRAGLSVGGLAQQRCGDGYEVVDLASGARCAVAYTSPTPEMCDLAFRHEVFDDLRHQMATQRYDVVIMPVGRLEARGAGHWPNIRDRLDDEDTLVILCLRPMILAAVALDLPDPIEALELPAPGDRIAAFTAALV